MDLARYRQISSLFEEIGFETPELEMRGRCLVFHSAQRTIHTPGRKRQTEDEVRGRRAIFARR